MRDHPALPMIKPIAIRIMKAEKGARKSICGKRLGIRLNIASIVAWRTWLESRQFYIMYGAPTTWGRCLGRPMVLEYL
jgi:hypothetical protein